MNITSKTKKLLVVAFVAATAAVAAVVYLFIQIQQQGRELTTHLKVLAVAEDQQEAYTQITRTIAETAGDRQKIRDAFFAEQADTLDFITYLEEDLAPRSGLRFTTRSLEALPVKDNPNATDMRMQFSYEGTKESVIDFSRLLESLPYHSRIESLSLTKGEDEVWEGSVTLVILLSTL